MKVLLDTHALLWWLFADRRLSRKARAVLREPATSVAVSSASAWEIATKYRLGRLDAARPLIDDFPGWIARAGFVELPMTCRHAVRAGLWDVSHRDPFDRMLAAQSELEERRLVSRDPVFADFGLEILW
jgi:PIN domain nuclease of toxin-antitoxin system